MTYHEIARSRRYEYRHFEDGQWWGWYGDSPATPETLARYRAGIPANEPYEIREICRVVDDTGLYVGTLIFSPLVETRGEDEP